MSFLQDIIYPRLPVFAQNWAISAYGYGWQRRRFGGVFEQELKGFKEREYFSAQQWRDYQTVQLRKLLVHAFESVPFYRERYGALGFSKSRFERFELEDLPSLPYLTKSDLRRFGTTTLLSSLREQGGQFFSSSGSTGTPVKILYSHHFHQRISAAYECRVRNWAGVNRDMPRGMIGGRKIIPGTIGSPPFYRYNAFEKQTYFSSYHISLKNAHNYLEGIISHDVSYMTGQATSNYILSKFIEVQGLEAPTLKAVITTSEKLEPYMREVLSRVYKCRVFDSYSGVENCGLISESPEGSLLISPDVGIIEVLNNWGTFANPGQEGELVCTGLLNFDQPLIRYKIGDKVILPEEAGLSYRNMPVVNEISGRVEDIIQTKDGRHLIRFDKIFVDLPNLVEAQLIQHNLNDYTIKAVVDKTLLLKDIDLIIQRAKTTLGEDISIQIQQVDQIERGPNGKFKSVISEIKH